MFEYHKKRLIGKKYGKLVVQECAGTDALHKSLWLCLCDCGNTKIIRNDSLRRGSTKSCGCTMNPCGSESKTWTGFQEIPGRLICRLRFYAKEKGYRLQLSPRYLWNLFLAQRRRCALSGMPIRFQKRKDDYSANASLDRIDSAVGYIEGNVQWVDKNVNFMKQCMDQKDFINTCHLISKFQRD